MTASRLNHQDAPGRTPARRRRFTTWAAALLAALAIATPVAANDSIAEMATGGLVFVRTDAIRMESEDLFVSMEEIRVDYVFRNTTEADVTATVAFPMPDVDGSPWTMKAIPEPEAANFLGFTVTVDGRSVEPLLQQRVFAAGVDYTSRLSDAGIPFEPFAEVTAQAISRLPRETLDEWVSLGLLMVDTYDLGQGMEDHWVPFWSLKTTYYWQTTFPAGQETRVTHTYRPSLGASVGLNFLEEGRFEGETFQDYERRYCMDESFRKAVARSIPPGEPWGSPYMEFRIGYILTTGQNWAGPIKRFRLVVDKGSPDNLVSFCGDGVRKIGPTTFEMTAEDFYPSRELDVLILSRTAPQP